MYTFFKNCSHYFHEINAAKNLPEKITPSGFAFYYNEKTVFFIINFVLYVPVLILDIMSGNGRNGN